MTFDANQPTETDETILVAVIDETYGRADSDDDWDIAREAFRLELEAEFDLPFEDADIGPGASFPAFATLIAGAVAIGGGIGSVLMAGKTIEDGIDAYLRLATRIRKLFTRRTYVNRNGAAVLAIEAVAKEVQGLPRSIKILGYAVQSLAEPDEPSDLEPLTEVADAVGTIYLGMVRHIFDIEANGARYRVSVQSQTVKVLPLQPALA